MPEESKQIKYLLIARVHGYNIENLPYALVIQRELRVFICISYELFIFI